MKRIVIIIIIALLSSEVPATIGTSPSYRLLGFVRGIHWGVPVSPGFKIGEGFLRKIYFPWVILGPLVTSAETQVVVDNKILPVIIYGANFVEGAAVTLNREGERAIAGTKVSVVSTGKITCEFDIRGAREGLWNLTVTNPDGRSGTLPSAVNLYPWPKVISIKPNKADNNVTTPIAVEIAGENFREGAKVSLLKTGEEDIIGTSISVGSPTRITCYFNVFEKSIGRWDVKVENSNGQSGTLSEGFKIEKPEFEIVKIQIVRPAAIPDFPVMPVAAASVKYELSRDAELIIKIFNMRGENIWSYTVPLGGEGGQAGENTVTWNGVTIFGAVAPAGVYFVRIYRRVGDKVEFIRQEKYGVAR